MREMHIASPSLTTAEGYLVARREARESVFAKTREARESVFANYPARERR